MKTVVYPSLWRSWAPPLIWALFIVALSGNLGSPPYTFGIFKWVLSRIVTLDPDTLSQVHFYFRKALHAICYGILSVLWFRALVASYPERLGINGVMALTLSLLVALTDEGRQYLVATRTASWWDIGLDMAGGVFFLFLATCSWGGKNRQASEVKSPSP